MGATVMESPVCTPIGSKFSIEQIMTQLSALSHDFHLVFLPAEQGFFDEDFRDGREVHAALGEFVELLAVVSDAAAGAAEGEGRPDDERITASLFRHGAGFPRIMRCAADGDIETDGEHELLEGFAVFALVNGLG